MIGRDPIGVRAIGELAPSDIFTPALAPQYFSSHGFITGPADTPANTYYDERVDQALEFSRSLVTDRLGGLASEAIEIKLRNSDGELDAWVDSYAFDGREARVLIGDDGFGYAEYGEVFRGQMMDLSVDEDIVTIRARTKLAALSVAIAANFYAGTGGAEGGADLAGKMKPLCWGQVFNVPALLVNSATLVYQVHDGAISDVPQVFDRGISLTKVGGTPAPGQYSVDTAAGTFTLGGIPDGQVTANVLGRVHGGYFDTVADIVEDILVHYSPLDAADLDAASFSALNSAQAAPMGLWLDAPASVADVVSTLLEGAGCFGTFTPLSVFRVGQFAAPAAIHDFELTADDIISVQRDPLPATLAPVVWRYQVGYARAYAVQTDLAAGVSAAQRTFAAESYRIAAAADAALKVDYQFAQDVEAIESPFAAQADAAAEAARLLALFRTPHALYTLTLKPALWTANLNDTVLVTYPRYRLNGGALGRVVAIDIDAAENRTVLTVFV